MRLSELIGKQIINIYDGARLGTIAESDLLIDTESGEIESIIIPKKNNILNIWLDKPNLTIPWGSIKKIGREVIIIDLDQSYLKVKSFS